MMVLSLPIVKATINSLKWSFLLSFDSYLVTNSYVRIKFKDQLQPKLMKKNHCSMTHLRKNGRQFKPMIHKREGGGGMYRNIKNNIPAESLIELRVQKNINTILQNNVM